MKTAWCVLVLALAAPLSAQPVFQREIREVVTGLGAVRLDRHVYEAARADLGDLRILDGRREAVPYLLEQAGREGARVETMSPRWSRAFVDDPRETWLTVELGARHQPFVGFVLEVENDRFRRPVRVEAREEPVMQRSEAVAPRDRWRPLGDGVVFRVEERGDRVERLHLDVVGRARVVRLYIEDGDDRPLRVAGVTVLVPVERLVFQGNDRAEYVLTYGAAGLQAPRYDLAQTLGKDEEAHPVSLGPPVRQDVEADVLPWTERHPALLWVGLVLVVAALGVLTLQALRSA